MRRGTSMAAAAVAGLVALIVQSQILHGNSYSFSEIKKILQKMQITTGVLRPREFLLTVRNDKNYSAEYIR